MGTAGFDRDEDQWPRKWAEAYVAFAAGEKGPWLREWGIKFFPVVGWAERGAGAAQRTFSSLDISTAAGGRSEIPSRHKANSRHKSKVK